MSDLLIETLMAWTTSLLTCCTALHLWFNTDLRVFLLRLLKRVGWRKHYPGVFWPEPDEMQLDEMSRQQVDRWLAACVQDGTLPELLVHVLGCPGCLSVHAAHVTGWLVLAAWKPSMAWQNCAWFLLAVVLTLPWLACRMTQVKKT